MRKPRLPQPGASRSQSASRTGNILTDSGHYPKASNDTAMWQVEIEHSESGVKTEAETMELYRSEATQIPLRCALSIFSIGEDI